MKQSSDIPVISPDIRTVDNSSVGSLLRDVVNTLCHRKYISTTLYAGHPQYSNVFVNWNTGLLQEKIAGNTGLQQAYEHLVFKGMLFHNGDYGVT